MYIDATWRSHVPIRLGRSLGLMRVLRLPDPKPELQLQKGWTGLISSLSEPGSLFAYSG
jgi:hypothetical protein